MRCALYCLLLFVGLSFSQNQVTIIDKSPRYTDRYQNSYETFAVLANYLNVYYPENIEHGLNSNEKVVAINFNVTLERDVTRMCQNTEDNRLSNIDFVTCQLNQDNQIVISEHNFYACSVFNKDDYVQMPKGLFLQNAELSLGSQTIDYIPGETNTNLAIIRKTNTEEFHYPFQNRFYSSLWRNVNSHNYGEDYINAIRESALRLCPFKNN